MCTVTPRFLKTLLQDFGNILVSGSQELGTALYDGDIDIKRGIVVRHFQGNGASA